VARGAGDELSDLDLGIGVSDEAWPRALAPLAEMLRRLDDPIDVLEHEIEEWCGRPHRRFFVQYDTGLQLDLVAMQATARTGLPPGSIALYDPDGRLAEPMAVTTHNASAADVTEWTWLAWIALGDLDKYLRRGSAWEALDRLHDARSLTWRLAAVAAQLPYPRFGLTTLLDGEGPLPDGIEASVAGLDPGALQTAALALAGVLAAVSEAAATVVGGVPPRAMAAYVGQRLRRWA
jgi:hypothetical protein